MFARQSSVKFDRFSRQIPPCQRELDVSVRDVGICRDLFPKHEGVLFANVDGGLDAQVEFSVNVVFTPLTVCLAGILLR